MGKEHLVGGGRLGGGGWGGEAGEGGSVRCTDSVISKVLTFLIDIISQLFGELSGIYFKMP